VRRCPGLLPKESHGSPPIVTTQKTRNSKQKTKKTKNKKKRAGAFGSRVDLAPAFLERVSKCGLLDNVLSFADFKNQKQLTKSDGAKKSRLVGTSIEAREERASAPLTRRAEKSDPLLFPPGAFFRGEKKNHASTTNRPTNEPQTPATTPRKQTNKTRRKPNKKPNTKQASPSSATPTRPARAPRAAARSS